MTTVFPNVLVRGLFEDFADWLWDNFAKKHVPAGYLEELRGMRNASDRSTALTLDMVSRRFNTLANLPADPQNIITMLEQELEKDLDPAAAHLLNRLIAALDHCSWCPKSSRGSPRLPTAPGCDSFAVWGSRTEQGRLFSSRNLDWKKDTGIATHKLISVFHVAGAVAPYATFGFANGIGAMAGMNRAGITVSEMNLDNSETTFDGPPFPLRLRMVLEGAANLSAARALWHATNNTDSMNFLVASGLERDAFEIEAMRGFSAFFGANDRVEATATCTVGTVGGGTCGSGYFPDAPPNATEVHIGRPLPEVVWRTNHAFHPTLMATQEPLFNDTTFRYALLRDQFVARQHLRINDSDALEIAAILGIKGANFYSCDAAQFGRGDNIMSVVYAPHRQRAHAWVAFEDGTASAWRPAACNPYVLVDFEAAGLW